MCSSERTLLRLSIVLMLLFVTALLPGCIAQNPSNISQSPHSAQIHTLPSLHSNCVAVDKSTYDSMSETVILHVHEIGAPSRLHSKRMTGEHIIDLSTDTGLINYANALYATQKIERIRVIYPHKPAHTVTVPSELRLPDTDSDSTTFATQSGRAARVRLMGTTSTQSTSGSILPKGASKSGHVPIPPPGVHLDYSIYWRVKLTASVRMKENAVVNEARSKMGTPYIWGHNEDRGQYGFDCSNFTAYVYHHALGYKFTGASRGQAKFVGVRVPISDMRRGDLIIFEHGKHVGIYVGKHRMIQEGGGIGKVGYLSLGPGSYWGKHITSVKRMF